MSEIEIMDEFIVKFLQGNITPAEEELLDSWLNGDTKNQSEFNSYKEVWEFSSRLGQMNKIDVAKARKRVKKAIPEFRKSNSVLFYWQRVAAIIILPLAIAAVIFLQLFKQRITDNIIQQEVTSSYGVRTQLNLPDGTNVWLNSGSKIIFPSKFIDNKREVFLEGEAFFNVTDDIIRPFYVNLGEVSVKAIGTSFNITAYENDNTFETTLISGKVLMVKKSEKKQDVVLYEIEPRQHAVYNRSERKITVFEDAVPPATSQSVTAESIPPELIPIKDEITDNKYTSWIEGKLIFRNDPMDEIVKRLGRWYNVDILLKDTLLYDYRYTATFIDETLEQVLGLLKLSAPIQYTITDRIIDADNSFSKKLVIITLLKKR